MQIRAIGVMGEGCSEGRYRGGRWRKTLWECIGGREVGDVGEVTTFESLRDGGREFDDFNSKERMNNKTGWED